MPKPGWTLATTKGAYPKAYPYYHGKTLTEGVREIMSRPCPMCDGEGVIKSEETIAIEFERRRRDQASRSATIGSRLDARTAG